MGIVLVLVAVGLGAAYYSGALEGFIRSVSAQAQGTGPRRVIRFPRVGYGAGGEGERAVS